MINALQSTSPYGLALKGRMNNNYFRHTPVSYGTQGLALAHSPETVRFGGISHFMAAGLGIFAVISSLAALLMPNAPSEAMMAKLQDRGTAITSTYTAPSSTITIVDKQQFADQQYLQTMLDLYNAINQQNGIPSNLSAQDQAKLLDLSQYTPDQLAYIQQQAQALAKLANLSPGDNWAAPTSALYKGFLENIVAQQLPGQISSGDIALMENSANATFQSGSDGENGRNILFIIGLISLGGAAIAAGFIPDAKKSAE